jgi:hypothetical protein
LNIISFNDDELNCGVEMDGETGRPGDRDGENFYCLEKVVITISNEKVL